jgi:hypothetical protein
MTTRTTLLESMIENVDGILVHSCYEIEWPLKPIDSLRHELLSLLSR